MRPFINIFLGFNCDFVNRSFIVSCFPICLWKFFFQHLKSFVHMQVVFGQKKFNFLSERNFDQYFIHVDLIGIEDINCPCQHFEVCFCSHLVYPIQLINPNSNQARIIPRMTVSLGYFSTNSFKAFIYKCFLPVIKLQ